MSTELKGMKVQNWHGYVPIPIGIEEVGGDLIRSECVYLSGPMSGIEAYNYGAFHSAAKYLRDTGASVFNPAETSDAAKAEDSWWNDKHVIGDDTRHAFMRIDLEAVMRADKVVVLRGWEKSRGATVEVLIAQECGIPVINLDGTRVHGDLWESLIE